MICNKMFVSRLFVNSKFGISFLRRLQNSATSSKLQVKPFNSIPGPSPWNLSPFLRPAWNYVVHHRPPNLFKDFFDPYFAQFGPIYRYRMPQNGGFWNLITLNIADFEEVIRTEGVHPERIHVIGQVEMTLEGGSGTLGLFLADGDAWYRQRHALNRPMLQMQNVRKYVPLVDAVTRDFVSHLDAVRSGRKPPANVAVLSSSRVHRSQSGTPVLEPNEVRDMGSELYKLAIESISNVLFGERLGCLSAEMGTSALEFVQSIKYIFFTSYAFTFIPLSIARALNLRVYREQLFHIKRMNAFVRSLLDKRIDLLERGCPHLVGQKPAGAASAPSARGGSSPAPVPVLEAVYGASGAKSEAGRALSRAELGAALGDLIVAAADTTTNTLQFTLHLVALHPDKQTRLVDELRRELPPDPNSELDRLRYLKAVVKEAQRVYPVVNLNGRVLKQDLVLPSGYEVPRGTSVIFPILKFLRDPSVFPRPDEFLPERWLRDPADKSSGSSSADDEAARPAATRATNQSGQRQQQQTTTTTTEWPNVNRYASLVFGFGQRACVGRRVAELEMFLCLAHLLRRFRVALPEREMPRVRESFARTGLPPTLETDYQFILTPSRPVSLLFLPRD